MPSGSAHTNQYIKAKRLGLPTPPSKGAKRTAKRLALQDIYLQPLRIRLQIHIATHPKGETTRIAQYIGVRSSQVHRWTCPKCEHDAEMPYSLGMALNQYLVSFP